MENTLARNGPSWSTEHSMHDGPSHKTHSPCDRRRQLLQTITILIHPTDDM